jgi:hypothetical protein
MTTTEGIVDAHLTAWNGAAGPERDDAIAAIYAWTLGVEGQAPVASGRDVLLMREGRITGLYVVIDS